MSSQFYRLVLTEQEKTMDAVQNVFFDDLPAAYRVYVLCYPGVGADPAILDKLTEFGKQAGNNCLVNIAKLNDPSYVKVRKTFDITNFPAIIVTATGDLAAPPSEYITGFVRMDNKALFKSPESTLTCVEQLFNLFIDGKFAQALQVKKHNDRMACIKVFLNDALKGIKGFLKEWDVTFSFAAGKFEVAIKPRGG